LTPSPNNANQRTQLLRGTVPVSGPGSTNYANFTYDPIGQLISDLAAELAGSTNRMNEQLRYAYDAAGNLNYRTNNTLVENFAVSSLNELTTGTNGGRLTVMGTTSSQATNVSVNGTNALLYGDATFASTNMPLTTSYTAIAKDIYGRISTNTATVSLSTNVSFQYDRNGNLTNDGRMSFGYDDENQLTQVWVPGQWFSQFTYDGRMRRRIRQEYTWSSGWVQTNIIYYVYDGNVVIQERDINNFPTATYTRGKDLSGTLQGAGGIGGLMARTDNTTGQPAFYHADGNGNETMLANSEEAVVAKYLYDAFGNTLSLSGPLAFANPYRFSSKEAHQNSGLVYYLYRYYDPNLQRWPNRDPISEPGFDLLARRQVTDTKELRQRLLTALSTQIPITASATEIVTRFAEMIVNYQSLQTAGDNLYGFVGNNPMNDNDPLGLGFGGVWNPNKNPHPVKPGCYDSKACQSIWVVTGGVFCLGSGGTMCIVAGIIVGLGAIWGCP
jgi:RHS repeat-associated protein